MRLLLREGRQVNAKEDMCAYQELTQIEERYNVDMSTQARQLSLLLVHLYPRLPPLVRRLLLLAFNRYRRLL